MKRVVFFGRVLALFAVLTVTLFSFGCTKKEGGAAAETVVKIGKFPGCSWNAQIPIAYKKGFFDEVFAGENVKFEFYTFVNGPAATEAFLSGELDIVDGIGDQPIVAGIGNGVKITVLSATSAMGSNIGIVVPDGSPIKNSSQLKGRKIGVHLGTNIHKSVIGVLSDAGIAEEEVSIVNITTASDGFAALARGDIEAYAQNRAYLIAGAKKDGLGNLIADFENYPAYGYIVARTEFIEKNPDFFKKFLKAAYKAQLYYDDNREDAYQILGEFYDIGTDGARLNNEGADIFLGITDKEYKHLRLTYQFLLDKGLIYSKIDDLDSHVDGDLINGIISAGL